MWDLIKPLFHRRIVVVFEFNMFYGYKLHNYVDNWINFNMFHGNITCIDLRLRQFLEPAFPLLKNETCYLNNIFIGRNNSSLIYQRFKLINQSSPSNSVSEILRVRSFENLRSIITRYASWKTCSKTYLKNRLKTSLKTRFKTCLKTRLKTKLNTSL